MTTYYVTDEPWPASAEVVTAAAGAVILHGIPPSLTGVIAPGTLGAVEVADPEPVPPEPTAEERIAELEAIIAALVGDAP